MHGIDRQFISDTSNLIRIALKMEIKKKKKIKNGKKEEETMKKGIYIENKKRIQIPKEKKLKKTEFLSHDILCAHNTHMHPGKHKIL